MNSEKTVDVVNVITIITVLVCSVISYVFFRYNGQEFFRMYLLFMAVTILLTQVSSMAKNERLSAFFMALSVFTMSYLFIFRNQTGIDDHVYRRMFTDIGHMNLRAFIKSSDIEIGYKTINYLIYKITDGDYNICQVFFAFIPIALIESTLWKNRHKLDLSIATLYVYMTLYYFIMSSGLVRVFFAVSIVFYGFRYIIEQNIKKYIITVIIASLFHRSACVMLILLILFIKDNYFYKHIKPLSIVLFIVVPVVFVLVSKYIVPSMGDRYQHYALETASEGSVFGFIDRLPFIIMTIFYMPILSDESSETKKEIRLYLVLMLLTVSINIATIWTDLGRTVYYTNCGITLAISFLNKQNKIRYSRDGIILAIISVVLPYIYMMHTSFYNLSSWIHLNNYTTFFH